MKFKLVGVAALCGLGLTGAHAANLANDEQKALYAIGAAISQSLGDLALSEAELEIVKSGISDGVMKRPLKVDPQAMAPKIQQLVQARSATVAEAQKKTGAAFLAKAAAESGASKTASGAIVSVMKEGSGPSPKASDTVKVHYQGTLIDGTVFDSSYQRGQPAEFALNQVIAGWTEGVAVMPVGAKYRFWIPASIAYGEKGTPPTIGPNATLVFDVELLDVL